MTTLSSHPTISVVQRLKRFHLVIAAALLGAFFVIGITSMSSESAIIDELAHITAAYSYDHYGDYRLNPEHPPLIKDLAGLPLQFMHLNFPSDNPAWTTQSNGQYSLGYVFIYQSGNDANRLIFWARLPILLLATAFGLALYLLIKRRFGVAAGLLTLGFYTFSPNIIAHARYVTTDIGASAFIFLALAAYVRYVERPQRANLILLSVALAVASLAKFSAFLLYPLLLVVSLAVASWWEVPEDGRTRLKRYLGGFLAASALSFVWIYLFYIPNIINTPAAVQQRLITGSLPIPPGQAIGIWLASLSPITLLRPILQYVLGLLMVFGRVSNGNVTYFNGVVTNRSFHGYFPEIFVLKTQISFLILMAATGLSGLAAWWLARRRRHWARVKVYVREHFFESLLLVFVVFYFTISVSGNLNLGIRHILPIYPPLFTLVAISAVRLVRRLAITRLGIWSKVVLLGLVGWYGAATLIVYPAYTSYFNEFIGGAANADQYFSDSGVDWGQDLRHLNSYVIAHPEVTHLAIDYFGGGDTRYIFCGRYYDPKNSLSQCSHGRFEDWHAQSGVYTGQYLAVSETYLVNDLYFSSIDHYSGYGYLRAMKPIEKIGGSIYLYKLY